MGLVLSEFKLMRVRTNAIEAPTEMRVLRRGRCAGCSSARWSRSTLLDAEHDTNPEPAPRWCPSALNFGHGEAPGAAEPRHRNGQNGRLFELSSVGVPNVLDMNSPWTEAPSFTVSLSPLDRGVRLRLARRRAEELRHQTAAICDGTAPELHESLPELTIELLQDFFAWMDLMQPELLDAAGHQDGTHALGGGSDFDPAGFIESAVERFWGQEDSLKLRRELAYFEELRHILGHSIRGARTGEVRMDATEVGPRAGALIDYLVALVLQIDHQNNIDAEISEEFGGRWE